MANKNRRYIIVLDLSAEQYSATADDGFYAPDGDDPYGKSSLAGWIEAALDDEVSGVVTDVSVYTNLDDMNFDRQYGYDMFKPESLARLETVPRYQPDPVQPVPDAFSMLMEHSRHPVVRPDVDERDKDEVRITGLVSALGQDQASDLIVRTWPTRRVHSLSQHVAGAWAFEATVLLPK